MSINTVSTIVGEVPIRHVIVSVWDKAGLEELVSGLVQANQDVCIYSTGGTFSRIKEILGGNWNRNLVSVSEYTGQPEMQGGLVKTLDFKIYLGILSESYNTDHQRDIERVGGVAFDMVVCNLYPFSKTVAQADATVESARGNIDIGGPCMLRASAKNFLRVTAVSDPTDYPGLIEELKASGGSISLKTRFSCSCKAFRHTADYDTAIAEYLESQAQETLTSIYDIS